MKRNIILYKMGNLLFSFTPTAYRIAETINLETKLVFSLHELLQTITKSAVVYNNYY